MGTLLRYALLGSRELLHEQLVVRAPRGHELVVAPLLGYRSVIEETEPVDVADRGETVRNYHDGPAQQPSHVSSSRLQPGRSRESPSSVSVVPVDGSEERVFSIRGSRVLIRDLVETDRDDFLGWASDEPMYAHMTFRFASKEEATTEFERLLHHPSRRAFPRKAYYTAVLHIDGDRSRFAGISGFDVHRDGTGEFGWYLASPFWNKGLATEASELLLRLGFEDLDLALIKATCDPLNAASRRVLEKSGLHLVGERPHPRPTWQGPRPRLEFAVSRDEWARRNANADEHRR